MQVGRATGVGAGRGLQGPKKSSGSKGAVSPTSADEYSVRAKTKETTLKNQNYLGTLPPEILEITASFLNRMNMLLFRQVDKNASKYVTT